MNPGAVFFVLCAIAVLTGALGVVTARSPIRSALGLLVTLLGIAGLFLLLHAEFLAAVQTIVYAGAVVVLFVFVIMVVGPEPGAVEPLDKSRNVRLFGTALMLGFVGLVLGALVASRKPVPFGPARVEHGTVEAVGGLLFSKGLVPLELATVLLVVAIVAALALARGRPALPAAPRAEDPEDASAGRFGGPIETAEPREPAP
jgi:NADH-quinone oxidoreductase subunit J